ncbi:hypothetical protein L3V82_07305 [Thiotrichales bacterium 19S3-7]|nr:hypothetical protein [Thiotrichales bacterium 19S3-7]MCF6801964.1 hypothetical protein [Thiotrichales bacterium 19S3-11]
MKLNYLLYLLLIIIPIQSYSFSCKSVAVINVKNSCPFTLNVGINNGKSTVDVAPGANKTVTSVSNGTVTFNDGIVHGSCTMTTSASGNWWDGCTARWQASWTGGFDDASYLNSYNGSPSWSDSVVGVKQKGTWTFNLTMCANGYNLYPTTIGLGKVYILKNGMPDSNGYVTLTGDSTSNNYDSYTFNFTSTPTACHLKYDYGAKHYNLYCDSSNVQGFFMNDHKNIVFMCQQDSPVDSKCPYVTPKGTGGYQAGFMYDYLN